VVVLATVLAAEACGHAVAVDRRADGVDGAGVAAGADDPPRLGQPRRRDGWSTVSPTRARLPT